MQRECNPTPQEIEKFWSRVDKSAGEDACWLWTAGRTTFGYGMIRIGGQQTGSHRVSWVIANGTIGEGLFACHKCDNPQCVNPSHIFLGTSAENTYDRSRKGRTNRSFGEESPSAKLKEWQVREIRTRYAAGGVSHTELGREYGVHCGTIGEITRGEIWKHIK